MPEPPGVAEFIDSKRFYLVFLAMRKFLLCALIVLAGLLRAGTTLGADLGGLQPSAPYGVFSTLTATSPPKGRIVASVNYENTINDEFYRFGTNVAVGLTDNLEFSISLADQAGLEDYTFGLKHRIIDESEQALSLAYVLTASLASGTPGISTNGRWGGGLVVSKRVGPVYGHANLFFAKPGKAANKDEVRFSAGFVFSAAHNLWLMGELFGRSSHYSNDIDQVETRIGYRMLIGENLYASIGGGVDLWASTPRYRLMASLSFILPSQGSRTRKMYEE